MLTNTICIIGLFTIPRYITVDPLSMLWLLPLTASIAIVYKTTKIPKIKAFSFIKEVVLLFLSIVVFMAVTAVVLYGLAVLLTE